MREESFGGSGSRRVCCSWVSNCSAFKFSPSTATTAVNGNDSAADSHVARANALSQLAAVFERSYRVSVPMLRQP
jgi:hypothetical protein